jgi:hypothetical protein
MYVSERACLFAHRASHGFDAVPNRNDRSAAASVEDFAAVGRLNETTLTAHRFGVRFEKIAREKGVRHVFIWR